MSWFKSRASQEALMARQIQIVRDCREAIESLTYKVTALKAEVAELKRKIQPHGVPYPGFIDPRSKYGVLPGDPPAAMASAPSVAPMSRDVHPAPTSGMDPLLAGALGYVLGSSGSSESHQQQDDTPMIVSGGGGDFSGGGASGSYGDDSSSSSSSSSDSYSSSSSDSGSSYSSSSSD